MFIKFGILPAFRGSFKKNATFPTLLTTCFPTLLTLPTFWGCVQNFAILPTLPTF